MSLNRKILLQVTAPAAVIGLLLFGACLVSAWYINRLQADIAQILSRNVASLQTAQELEIRVRQLRFHCFLYLIDPKPERLEPINSDNQHFEDALRLARQSADTPEERACVQAIATGYQQYREAMDRLRSRIATEGPHTDFGKLADNHPVQHIVEPCQQLLRLNSSAMATASRESERIGARARGALLLLGVLGLASGLLIGYGVARGLSRSLYQLSVHVQDMAQRLDQDIASVSIVADGDIQSLDKQLQHVVHSVEEVAHRLQHHQREMLRAEQLSAVGQLAASVAHEVRNPLTAIKMLVEVALRPHRPQPLTPEDLRVIHQEIARLEQTVQGFLDFARLPSPQRSNCAMQTVIAQAVEVVQVRARQQQVEIVTRYPPETLTAYVDRNQLCTVLVNLFLNAFDAMPLGGRLEVILGQAADGGIRLTVADTGPGISPEMAGRLFRPFASSKPTGTGLGLSLSRRILEEHGGCITAANRPQGGACFTITLPMPQQSPVTHTTQAAAT